jgi:hypothetical protein
MKWKKVKIPAALGKGFSGYFFTKERQSVH